MTTDRAIFIDGEFDTKDGARAPVNSRIVSSVDSSSVADSLIKEEQKYSLSSSSSG